MIVLEGDKKMDKCWYAIKYFSSVSKLCKFANTLPHSLNEEDLVFYPHRADLYWLSKE